MQKELIGELLHSMHYNENIPIRQIKLLRDYMVSDLNNRQMSRKYKMPAEAVEEVCMAACETFIKAMKTLNAGHARREKSLKLQMFEMELRQREWKEREEKINAKRAQATPQNPDIKKAGFTTRLINVLLGADIILLEDLAQVTEKEFLCFRNSGKTTLEEAKQKLKEYNLSFKEEK